MSTMIPKEKLCEMYTKMLQIRKFDEKIAYFFTLGKVHGTTHLYIGEEATAVGVCSALKDTDYMTSTHRGHGHCQQGIHVLRICHDRFWTGLSAGVRLQLRCRAL